MRRIDLRIALGAALLALPLRTLADEPGTLRAARQPTATPATAPSSPAPSPRPSAQPDAQPSRVPAPPPAPTDAAPRTTATPAPVQGTVLQRLGSSDPVAVGGAIEQLRTRASAVEQRALIARVEAGLPPALTSRAIEALVALKAPRAFDVLLALMQHRRAEVRLRALAGIAVLAPRGSAPAASAAIAALEDPALEVRNAATRALTDMRQARALPALLSAHDRGLMSAAAAIGAIGGPAQVGPLLARVNEGVLDPIVPALDGFLLRTDFPRADKLALIAKLERVGSPSAQRYLLGLAPRIQPARDARLEQALADALRRLTGPAESTPVQPAPTQPHSPKAGQP